jgi:hypothetical protein
VSIVGVSPPEAADMRGLMLKTLAYWWLALMGLGLVTVIHGDCGTGNSPVDVCVSQKQTIAYIGIALAGLGYAALLYFTRRKEPKP